MTTPRQVLVIDDETDVRMIVRFCLERWGRYSVYEAASGRQGLEIAVSRRPDLILLDSMMPGMDGLEVFEALRARTSTADIPVVFLTARSDAAERDRALAMGVRDYLIKPFDPVGLADVLDRYFEEDDGPPPQEQPSG